MPSIADHHQPAPEPELDAAQVNLHLARLLWGRLQSLSLGEVHRQWRAMHGHGRGALTFSVVLHPPRRGAWGAARPGGARALDLLVSRSRSRLEAVRDAALADRAAADTPDWTGLAGVAGVLCSPLELAGPAGPARPAGPFPVKEACSIARDYAQALLAEMRSLPAQPEEPEEPEARLLPCLLDFRRVTPDLAALALALDQLALWDPAPAAAGARLAVGLFTLYLTRPGFGAEPTPWCAPGAAPPSPSGARWRPGLSADRGQASWVSPSGTRLCQTAHLAAGDLRGLCQSKGLRIDVAVNAWELLAPGPAPRGLGAGQALLEGCARQLTTVLVRDRKSVV